MEKKFEVEVRGKLNDAEYTRIKSFFDTHARHVESHEREMFLLRDYPGFSKDFVSRHIDIRLRNTNGACEIMLKRKTGDAREEISLKLADNDLEQAKKIVRALGCTSAVWMHRLKQIYEYEGIEWSLVIAPKNIRYYEAEIVAATEAEVSAARKRILAEAEKLGLEVLDDPGTRELIHQLNTEANKLVEL